MPIVCYNIRKAVGLDWKRDPQRIADVLGEIELLPVFGPPGWKIFPGVFGSKRPVFPVSFSWRIH